MISSRLPPRLRPAAELVVEVAREISRDRVTDNAAGVTFYMVFAIPAAALALTALLGLVEPVLGAGLRDEASDTVAGFVRDEISPDPQLVGAVEGLFDQRSAGLFTFALVLALFTMSRGFAGLVRALDAVYDLDDHRSFVNVRLTALVLSVGTVVMLSLTLTVLTVGPFLGVGEQVAAALGQGDTFVRAWQLARGPVVLVLLVLWAATVFHVGPDHHTPWRYDLPGAAATAVIWVALSLGFRVYVSLTQGGNQVVGVIGVVLVALTWLFLMITALLVGGELNAVIAQRAGLSQQRSGPDLVGRLASEARDLWPRDDQR